VSGFAQRVVGLAAAALLGLVVALAIDHERSKGALPIAPQPAAASPADWYTALAGVRAKPRRRSACGWLLRKDTLGVGHPVLPCGARIFIAYGGKRVLTEVIDRGPYGSGREFDLTPALAKLVGLQGVREIRWTFAGRGGS
jgi:rare lipoprotein A (peptidoglycan hydrolase)